MKDHENPAQANASSPEASRREFVALSAAAVLMAATGSATAAAADVVATDVDIKTPDGTCDAAFFHLRTGSYPGVVLWTDVFGLRSTFREFGRRLAAEGYAVLVPNPFYRTAKAPLFDDPSKFDFGNPDNRAKLHALTAPAMAPGAVEKDATAYVNWLDSQRSVNKHRKIGTQGYCMGGPLVLRTAAAMPGRVGAGASFHGGGLVTDMPDSPHLLAPKIKAQLYIAIAASDDDKQPDAKDKLKAAFSAAKVSADVVVISGTQHGWCVPDVPMQPGKPVYDKANAEAAWAHLLLFYKSALA
jgi:carboxymethylenebutenolidase